MELYSEQNLSDLNNIVERFRTNLKGFFKENHYLLTLLLIAAIVDCFSTIYFMHSVGPAKEIHPLIRQLGFIVGPTGGPILGKLLQVCFGVPVLIYLKKHSAHILAFTAVMYSWAAVSNFLTYMIF